MDDFNVSSLYESRSEWASRLVTILTPLIVDGYKSILEEAVKLCKENNETEKYLMTLQNFISRVPRWNSTIIENERKRICEKSGCIYLEDLVTCIHIIQLKLLTAMRVGNKQKKIDINIPKLDDFIHKIYINVARKIYKCVYLFEINITSLQIQKHNRELEIIVQECIMNTLRESIPVESILKAYMDETVEEDVVEEIKEQYIDEPLNTVKNDDELLNTVKNDDVPLNTVKNDDVKSSLTFNDYDYTQDENKNEISISAPKTLERLAEITEIRTNQRKLESEEDDYDDSSKIKITDQDVELGSLDVHNINEPEINLLPDLLIDEIEILD
jgi:hypothetical protein